MLAAAAPAEGKVVVTTKTVPITTNQTLWFDLNKDGIADFQFKFLWRYVCAGTGDLVVKGPARNGVVGGPLFGSSGNPYAAALVRGAKIGPSAQFADYAVIEDSLVNYCSGSSHRGEYGHWGGNTTNRYLGVKFFINGALHYGWIRLTTSFPDKLAVSPSATITAYAYETVANKAISAGSAPSAIAEKAESIKGVAPGQPSLGMLALGADGLAIWRREEEWI
ncbi:MAG: hypothetical protein ACRD3B_02715 [Candidatus Sulfotelmatobacter sp.]